LILKNTLLNLRLAVSILIKSRSLRLVRVFFRFKISISIIRKWEAQGHYPCADLILDQGPIFCLTLAEKEKLFNLVVSKDDVLQVKHCVHYVYRMNASVDTLYQRVQKRPPQLGRGQFLSSEEFSQFCHEYNEAFSIIHDLDIPSSDLNTDNVTPAEVLQQFNEAVKNG
jgi:hypothetical protein